MSNFTCISTILGKFDIYFLGLPWKILIGVTVNCLQIIAWAHDLFFFFLSCCCASNEGYAPLARQKQQQQQQQQPSKSV